MPAQVLTNENEPTPVVEIYPEIIGYKTEYKPSAEQINACFDFVSLDDANAIAAKRDGVLFTTKDEQGIERLARKVNGRVELLVYRSDLYSYVTQEVAKLKPFGVLAENPTLPTSTEARPITQAARIVFLLNGEVDGRAVTAGATASVTRDIPPGEKVSWNDLLYNEAEQLEIQQLELQETVRRDGSAQKDAAVSEWGVNQALTEVEQNLGGTIAEINSRLTSENNRLSGSLASQAITIEEQNQQIEQLLKTPQCTEEEKRIGDGVSQIITVRFDKKFTTRPRIQWQHLKGNGLYVDNKAQDGNLQLVDGRYELTCAFSYIPNPGEWKVIAIGDAIPS